MKRLITLLFSVFAFAILGQVNQTDAKGRKQGIWEKTYPNSRVFQYRGQFKDDKPVGTFTYFYPNQKVKAVVKHDPVGNRSVANLYHDNGIIMGIGIYRNEQKDSIWLNYGPSGRISNSETYKNGVLHGLKVIYFVPEDPEDKTQRIAAKQTFVNGKIDGEFVEYFDNGQMRRTGKYVNFRPDGEWVSYQPTGAKLMLERYKDGKQHGYQIAYDDAGKFANRVYYYYGKRLEGKALEEKLALLKEKGIDPNN